MKYKYTVIVESERNCPPDYKIQERIKREYPDWEITQASTVIGERFEERDLHHVLFATTVVLRQPII